MGDTDIKSYRILKLNQFLNVYNHIKQQAEALKMCDNNNDQNPSTSQASACSLKESKLFDT